MSLDSLAVALRRFGTGALVLRAVALGSGFSAVLLALPSPLRYGMLLVLAALLAVGAAIGVDTPWVSTLQFGAVLLWFATTTLYRLPLDPPQTLGLMVALYLHHSACTAAASLPVDAAVTPQLIRQWALRTAGVLAASLVIGVVVLALPDILGRTSLVLAPLLGLLTLLVAGFLLVRLARRP